jgi:uncharacterized protein YbjT (DUF2867 family)
METTLLVAGATGLVGREVLRAAAASPRVAETVALVRRSLGIAPPGVRVVPADMTALDGRAPIPCTHAICALGTTIAKAGSQAAFRAIDLDAVVAFARLAKRGGATRFGLVSSVGATPETSNFYLRVKGEAEQAVAAIGFETVCLARPGLLLGRREESRPAETVFRAVGPALNLLLPGPLRRYRSIRAADVATGLLGAVLDSPSGVHVLHYDDMLASGALREIAYQNGRR